MYILYTCRRSFTRRTVKKYQCLLCPFHWNTEQILHYLSNRFAIKKKKDIYTLVYLLGKASYNRNNSRNNTDEHRWDIATPETNAALSKGQYITEGRVLTRNEFKRTNKSFVVQLSWIVNIPHGNPQSNGRDDLLISCLYSLKTAFFSRSKPVLMIIVCSFRRITFIVKRRILKN